MEQTSATQAPTKILNEDKLANLVGQFGKWQFIVCITLPIIKFSAGWVLLAIVFLTPKVTFWCKHFGENSTKVGDNMTCYSDCIEYEYDTIPFDNTLISEWGLVCERAWLASLTQTILQLGVLIGSIVFGLLSDRYGRRKTFLASVVGLIIIGFGIPFSPNYITFTTLRFFLGMATAGIMLVSFVLIIETVGSKYREVIGCLYHLPFVIGHMTLPLFAYYNRSWDTYSLALAMPSLLYLGYFFTVSESPRWLLSMGKVHEATRIVTKAAKMNNRPTEKIEETLQCMSDEIRSQDSKVKSHYGVLFKGPLLLKTISSSIVWMIIGLTVFGFNQYLGQTNPNPFIAVAVAGAMQIPALFISIWLFKNYGRRIITIIFFTTGGICILTLGFIPENYWINLLLGSIGISCSFIVAACIYLYTTELFPTVVRNMSMGVCSTCMRIGSMIAPFVANLSVTTPWLPTVIFGSAQLIGALVCLLLSETKGTALPDSIQEIDNKK